MTADTFALLALLLSFGWFSTGTAIELGAVQWTVDNAVVEAEREPT